MIKTIFMDLGNVTLVYDPIAMTEPYTRNAADRDAIIAALFDHPDWAACDAGKIGKEQLRENARSRLESRLHPALDRVVDNWPTHMPPIPGAEAFILSMQAEGKRVIALSNAPTQFCEYRDHYDILKRFDGQIISALIGCAKPYPEIFRYALDTYGLKPEECFFVDDLARNVEGARRAGIDGCVFHGDFEALSRLIHEKDSK